VVERWCRFIDEERAGSRIGRTLTAPADEEPRPRKFALVSCQSLPDYGNGYCRRIFEVGLAPAAERLGFVLHLGKFA
jgi:alkaline phosphatase D